MSNFSLEALRNDVVISDLENKELPDSYYLATSLELFNMGFEVSPHELEKLSLNRLTGVIKDASELSELSRDYTPMYPGFPETVKNTPTLTLLTEQLLHYFTNGEYYPDQTPITRTQLPLADLTKPRRKLVVINADTYARESIENTVTNKKALSQANVSLLQSALNYKTISLEEVSNLVNNATNGENIVHFANILSDYYDNSDIAEVMIPRISNVNTLLRLILNFYGEYAHKNVKESNFSRAVDLQENKFDAVKVKSMPKRVRKLILESLGSHTHDYKADLLVHKKRLWQKVLKNVHPYSFVLSDNTRRAVDIIHGNVEYFTLDSTIEKLLEEKHVKELCDVLIEHSNNAFLRRLVNIVRISDSKEEIDYIFDSLGKVKINNLRTLISVRNGVANANNENKIIRVANVANTAVVNDNPVIDDGVISSLLEVIDDLIVSVLKTKDAPVGNVGISSKDIFPLVERDTSISDRIIDRGSYVPISSDSNVLRFFQHWYNDTDTEDYVDLGLTFLDSKGNYLGSCSWNSWYSSRRFITYSGDTLVHPGESAVEFYDVDISALKEEWPSARYVTMSIISYGNELINDLDIFAGVMSRTNDADGELYDYRTISTAFIPTSLSKLSVPLVYDIENHEIVWIDSGTGINANYQTACTLSESIALSVISEIMSNKLTIGDIARMWACAHNANIVNEPANKETIINLVNS